MFWMKKKLEYSISIPPLTKPFARLTAGEAQTFFAWYMQEIPKRVEYISTYSANQLGIHRSRMDVSPESLILLWQWFLDIAELERTPQKRLDELHKIYKDTPIDIHEYLVSESVEQFSLQTEFILRDIGMYVGEVFTKNNPSIHWGYYNAPKTDFFVNMPLLLGFEDSSFSPPFKMSFEPVHMVGVQAANIWDKTQKDDDLFRLYQNWLKYVPYKT